MLVYYRFLLIKNLSQTKERKSSRCAIWRPMWLKPEEQKLTTDGRCGVQLKCEMCNCAYDTAENISKRMFYTFEKKSCFWVIAKSSWETWAILVKESSKVVGSFHLKGSGLSDNDHLVYAAWTIPLSFTFIFTYGRQLTRARQFQASSLNSSLKSCQTLTKMPPHVLNNNMRLLLFSRHLSPPV